MTTNWIEQFNKEFKDLDMMESMAMLKGYKPHRKGWLTTQLKNFITTLLEKQREEDINKFVKQIQDKANTTRPNLLLNEIVNLKYNFLKSHDKKD